MAVVALIMLMIAGAPVAAQSSGSGQAAEISREELVDFVAALEEVQSLQQEMATTSQQSVQDSEMGEARFQELFQAQQSGQSPATPPSDAEQAEFDALIQQLQQIQQESNQLMVEAVQDEGLDVQRFNTIARAVQQNPELMERLQAIRSEQGAGS